MKPDIEELRKKYIENPPEGMTSRDIRHMSEEELLDMDYFLNDDELDDDFWRGRFLYLLIQESSCRRARLRAGIFQFKRAPQAVFPIKQERILLCRILRLWWVAISDIYLSAASGSCPAGLFYAIGNSNVISYSIKKENRRFHWFSSI